MRGISAEKEAISEGEGVLCERGYRGRGGVMEREAVLE
jgi:hypothetical protein